MFVDGTMIINTKNNDIILIPYTIPNPHMNVRAGDIIQDPLKAARRSYSLPSSIKNLSNGNTKPRPPRHISRLYA